MPVPALIAILLNKEREKGSPLVQSEVESIRDTCACIMVRASVVQQMAESRGYDDIDLQFVWEQWQQVRDGLHDACDDA